MNKELGYVWEGTFLVVVVIIGMWVVQVLGNIGASIDEQADAEVAKTEKKAVVQLTGNSAKGKALFDEKCATCHGVDKELTGPALRGIQDRVKDKKLLHDWIRNSPAVLKAGNPYFQGLYEKYGKVSMSVFPSLTDEEIDNILLYIGM
ncbi:c-type cytochrome [Paraflavitalea sp. CAU 1676]|uniref:c-type cytochrome n=1 Tax=Paraflavitalea sp. CAU 1676 TaxID=3032598 RepID=UPI0023DB2F48|nr:c-type cytochrome [Paraflavitalea sp. CAU 1676]MDF2187399.1 c-type cytochrome [Paraflavitalea sp. CAU 1676]